MKESEIYDYAIVGAGAAGLHLALAMSRDSWFDDKQILILEKDEKEQNDKTWCYWEKGDGFWDDIISQRWKQGHFRSSNLDKELVLNPYEYKMLRAIDFYHFASKRLDGKSNFTRIQASVKAIDDGTIESVEGNFKAKHVFDSRIDPAFFEEQDNSIRILQHFKGWVIETEEAVFDPSSFSMMDFRVKYKDSASFTYVLPYSERKALIEFTLFTSDLIEDDEYDICLKKYISEVLHLDNYRISEIEKGVIPMTDYPFEKSSTSNLTKIGTAGGWVKPSSGYSFKNSERSVQMVIDNLKRGVNPSLGLIKKRFRFYDRLFLRVLRDENHKGEKLFETMYKNSPPDKILKFLEDGTSVWEEMKIISRMPWGPFLRALFKGS